MSTSTLAPTIITNLDLALCQMIVVDRSMNSNRLKYKLTQHNVRALAGVVAHTYTGTGSVSVCGNDYRANLFGTKQYYVIWCLNLLALCGPCEQVVLGNEAVGKTSILTRFMYDTFNPTYNVTIGIDFVCKNFYLQDRVVRLQLWDTAGQERFRSLIPSYIRDCAAALIVFDVTSRESFLGTTAWIRDIRAERGDDVVLVLVGNRCDMEAQRQVSTEEAQQHAQSLHVAYMETSAKTGRNVRELFTQIAQALPHASGDNAAPSAASVAGAAASAAPTRGGGMSVDVNQPASDRRYCCM